METIAVFIFCHMININNLHFSFRLDHWSTIVGMFIAFNFQRFENFVSFLDEK